MSAQAPLDPAAEAPDLTLVVPVYDEEGNLEPLWVEIADLLRGLDLRAEVIFVNDGSTDGSGALLDRLRAADGRIRVIDQDRNHGLTAALDCGFRHARGEVIGMLDADMQNPPAAIADLLAALPGTDMVIGWRRERNDPWIKRISSRIANAYRNRRTNEQVHDVACGLKVFRREILERIKLWNGMHRFLPTLARMEGFKVVEVPVPHRLRASGTSSYGVWNRVWKGLRDVKAIRWMWRNRLSYVPTERPPASTAAERSGPEDEEAAR